MSVRDTIYAHMCTHTRVQKLAQAYGRATAALRAANSEQPVKQPLQSIWTCRRGGGGVALKMCRNVQKCDEKFWRFKKNS